MDWALRRVLYSGTRPRVVSWSLTGRKEKCGRWMLPLAVYGRAAVQTSCGVGDGLLKGRERGVESIVKGWIRGLDSEGYVVDGGSILGCVDAF